MTKNTIELLNKALQDELTAVHQYLYFHFHCEDQGLDLLAGLFKRTAVEEMGHISKLAERILFLEGEVEMQVTRPVDKTRGINEMLKMSRRMEGESIKEYNTWARECNANNDAVSRQLLEKLAADEEKHYDQFDKEMTSIEKYGDSYLALQSIERSKSVSR